METNVILNIPTQQEVRVIIHEELKEFLKNLILILREKENPKYLNGKQVSERLHISLPTLRRWTKEGILIPHRVGNSRKVLFKTEEIENLLERKNLMKWKLAS